MNIKSLLLASAAALTVAVAAGNAVAGNYDFRDQASASMNAPVATRSMDAPKAAMRGADAAGQLHGNITPFVADKTPSTLTRAEVRAETIKYNNSAEGRAARARDIGGAQ
jgi:hypothetical protein